MLKRLSVFVGMLLFIICTSTGCNWDGHFNMLGYSTRPNYDESIQTVYVPIFENKAFQTTPSRNLEMELTRAVIREIEAKTPFKVISDPERADTELFGTILFLNKRIQTRNQLNEVREFELFLGVELVWRDLRSGKILSNPSRSVNDMEPSSLPVFDPSNPPIQAAPDKPQPVVLQTTGRGLIEVGESNTTAQKMAVDRMAIQIVSMMEKPWTLNRQP